MSKFGLKFVYGVGLALGVVGLVLTELLVSGTEFSSALQRSTIFATLGLGAGILWPLGRWHWGVALALPLTVLMIIHVASPALSGHWHATLWSHDLPLLVGVITGGLAGSEVGSRLRSRVAHAA